jgi:hypothetical protein
MNGQGPHRPHTLVVNSTNGSVTLSPNQAQYLEGDVVRLTPVSDDQGSGSTETGVYELNGATSGIFTAQSGATIWLPTESEWYKAAYSTRRRTRARALHTFM